MLPDKKLRQQNIIRESLLGGVSANAIQQLLRQSGVGMRRQVLLTAIRERYLPELGQKRKQIGLRVRRARTLVDRAAHPRVPPPHLPYPYAKGRFTKDLEYDFQGHVFDRWRRKTYVDIAIYKSYFSNRILRRVVRGQPQYMTVLIGAYTHNQLAALSRGQVTSKVNNQIRLYGIMPGEYDIVGLWASKKRLAMWSRTRTRA